MTRPDHARTTRRVRTSGVAIGVLAVLPVVLLTPTGLAMAAKAQPRDIPVRVDPERDGVAYPVTDLRYVSVRDHRDLPDLSFLDSIEVELVRTGEGLIAPFEGARAVPIELGEIGTPGNRVLYRSALSVIIRRVRDVLEDEAGLLGHLVTPSPEEIAYETTGEDLRTPDETVLTIRVWPVVIGEIRTVARGERIAEREDERDADERVSNINHPAHERLRRRFTLEPGDLLMGPRINEEVFRMNRHPGRRADVSVAPSAEQGEVVVDYLITEPKQWAVYARLSNTGTESTDELRQQFGFIHRQLTGRDDILQIDYITASFDETHAVLASYTVDAGDHARLKVFGRWNEYTSSDVGLGAEVFEGQGYEIGAELFGTVWSDGPKRVELFGGLRFEHVEVDNLVVLISGDEDFLLPFVGVRYIKSTPQHSAFGEVRVETNLASAAGTGETTIGALGRPLAENEFTVLRGQLSHAFYLEPILDPGGFRGERGPEAMRLAHEVEIRVRGQTGFGDRLAPNYQQVAGGAATVRGYDESVVAGDDAIVGTLEYKYHFGRATPIASQADTLFGQPFRTARTRPFGSADWDVILSAFVDIGRVTVQDALFFEESETLVGAGIGVEARLKRNVTLNLDLGVAFTRTGEASPPVSTDVGDSRLHFAVTLVF